MDTKALRQKILDLAIRGKLVPQDPNDEPASALLERIRDQKQQMVKEGKIKKKDIKNDSVIFVGEDNLHYEKFADGSVKCIEDEIPFELPEGWAWCHYTDVIELYSGQDLTPDRYNDIGEGIPYITGASNLEHGKVIINRWTTTPTTHATIGDLLLTVKGSGVGKMAFCDIIDAHIARQIMALRCTNAITPQYLYIAISAMLSDITAQANGIIPGIRREIVLGAYLPLPPLSEQEKICKSADNSLHIIDDIDSNKGDLKEIIQITKSKILDLAIRGQLVPQSPDDEPASVLLEHIRAEKEELINQGKIKRDKKESIIFKGEDNSYYEKIGDKVYEYTAEDLPLGWSIASFSQANMFSTETIDPSHFPAEMFELYSVPNFELGVPEIIKGREIGSSKQSICENDVLVCKINPRINRVWIAGHITSYRILGSSEWVVFRNDYLYAPYMQFYFSAPYFRELLLSNVSGVGGSLMRAQPESVKKYPILVPPYKEQVRIAEKISELFIKLDDIEKGAVGK